MFSFVRKLNTLYLELPLTFHESFADLCFTTYLLSEWLLTNRSSAVSQLAMNTKQINRMF